MKLPKIAILHHPRAMQPGELAAASEGLREFQKFGVICEEISVEGSVSKVKRGLVLKDSIYSTDFSIHPFDLYHMSPYEFLRGLVSPADTMGIAVTGAVLFDAGDGVRTRRMGLSANGVGGIVSISRLREVCHREQKLSAIRLAVMHEAGHVLGRADHCANDNCLMQENKDHMDFLERFVERNLKICRDCFDMVACGVSKLAADLR